MDLSEVRTSLVGNILILCYVHIWHFPYYYLSFIKPVSYGSYVDHIHILILKSFKYEVLLNSNQARTKKGL